MKDQNADRHQPQSQSISEEESSLKTFVLKLSSAMEKALAYLGEAKGRLRPQYILKSLILISIWCFLDISKKFHFI